MKRKRFEAKNVKDILLLKKIHFYREIPKFIDSLKPCSTLDFVSRTDPKTRRFIIKELKLERNNTPVRKLYHTKRRQLTEKAIKRATK